MQLTTVLVGSLFLTVTLGLPSAQQLTPRDSPNNRCGPSFGGNNCNTVAGRYYCCSQYNYCGDTAGHCGAGCQPLYGRCTGSGTTTTAPGPGPTTTTTTTPNPTTTSPVGQRPFLGAVPYGSRIDSCTVRGTIALTYDDGPYIYTAQLLDILRDRNVKATFFVVGNNLGKGAIDSTPQWTSVIRRMRDEGHQIGSHTWDHLSLDSLSETNRRYQMTRLETALKTIIGKFPTYMRPPYIQCQGACQATMRFLGYHTIIWDLNTDDYNNVTPELIENAKRNVRIAVDGTNPLNRHFMSIAHDIHQQTVINLTAYQIDLDIRNGYRHVRLGECFGDPEANWYRT